MFDNKLRNNFFVQNTKKGIFAVILWSFSVLFCDIVFDGYNFDFHISILHFRPWLAFQPSPQPAQTG